MKKKDSRENLVSTKRLATVLLVASGAKKINAWVAMTAA
jgi:hypothetical protein